jgi:hypothetical protein
VTAKWQVPEGDTIEAHYCERCGDPWALCVCCDDCGQPALACRCERECGSARFADCPLPLDHPGFCVERER